MSSSRAGASPSLRGGGDAWGDGGFRAGDLGSAQGTPVHVPMAASTDGTPSTAYLERARAFAERMQASMASAVKSDSLYNTLASSPATETFATARAKELMEELIQAERGGREDGDHRRDGGSSFYAGGSGYDDEGGDDLASRIARLADEPLRTGNGDEEEGGFSGFNGTSWGGNLFETPWSSPGAAPEKNQNQNQTRRDGFPRNEGPFWDDSSFGGRVERIPPATGGKRPADAPSVAFQQEARPADVHEFGGTDLGFAERRTPSETETEKETVAERTLDRETSFETTERKAYRSVGAPVEPSENQVGPDVLPDASAYAPHAGLASDKLALFSKYLGGFSGSYDAPGAGAEGGSKETRATKRELERVRRDFLVSQTENETWRRRIGRYEKKNETLDMKLTASKLEFRALRTKYVALGDTLESVVREKETLSAFARETCTKLETFTATTRTQKRKIKALERELHASMAREKEAVAKAHASLEKVRKPGERLAKETSALRDALEIEQKKRFEAEQKVTETEKKVSLGVERIAQAEESARRESVRFDAVSVDADVALRKKVALETQRLNIEMERVRFETETAFARRERALEREIDALKLELERSNAESNRDKADLAKERNALSLATEQAQKTLTLRLPAPGDKKRRGRGIRNDSGSDTDDDAKSVAASLASAVLKAIHDERRTGGNARGVGSVDDATRQEIAAAKALAEQSLLVSTAALRASEDEKRIRAMEEMVNTKLEAKLLELNTDANRRDRRDGGGGSAMSENERNYAAHVTGVKIEEAERLVELARNEAQVACKTAENAMRAEQEAVARCQALAEKATRAETALAEVRREMDGAEARVGERVAQEVSRRVEAERNFEAAKERLEWCLTEKEVLVGTVESLEKKCTSSTKEASDAKQKNAASREKLERLATEKTTVDAEFRKLDEELVVTLETLARLTGDAERTKAALVVAETQSRLSGKETAALESKIETLEKTVTNQTESVRDAEFRAADLQRKISEFETARTQLELEISSTERRAVDLERALAVQTNSAQSSARKVTEAVRALRRVKAIAAKDTKGLKDTLSALRRSVKERLDTAWEVMRAEAAEAARIIAHTASATLDPARAALASELAAAKEETRLAKMAQQEAREEAKQATAAAREDSRRTYEEAWREVHSALGQARKNVDDANAEAWMSNVELSAMRDGADGSRNMTKAEIDLLKSRATDAEGTLAECEKKLETAERELAAVQREMCVLTKENAEVDSLKKRANDAEGTSAECTKQLEMSKRELASVTCELTVLSKENDANKTEVDLLKSRANDAEVALAECTEELETSTRELATVTKEMQALATENDAHKRGEDVLRKTNVSTADELNKARAALREVLNDADLFRNGICSLFPDDASLPVLDENGEALSPAFIVTRAKTKVVTSIDAEKASRVKTQALVDRLHSARTQHEQLVRLHDEAMAKVVASGAAASATEAREELAEIREEVVGLRDAAHRDAALRSAALVEARDEATRETHRADAATFALDNARHALVKTETTAREREKMHEEALGRCRESLRVLQAKTG